LSGPDDWVKVHQEFDFRVGGRERLSGGPKGHSSLFRRAVPRDRAQRAHHLTYDMHLAEKRISVSLATVEFKPESGGTRLMTEQGVFLDGYDDAGSREQGTHCWLLGKLEAALEEPAAAE
jgi:uncharacterized protein YndB with AHSA1/START domain